LTCMTTDQKGAIAEAAIALAAIRLGIGVFRPLADERYDLIFDLHPGILRIQCKLARRIKDVLVVRCYSSRRKGEGHLRRGYSSAEIDAIAAYSIELDRCFLVPIGLAQRYAHLSLPIAPTRNGQRRGINWADDFDFAATLARNQGAIAQLGERRLGMAEVAGSSPAGSIANGPADARLRLE
jgi:PD-(D/E)XK endonuclease